MEIFCQVYMEFYHQLEKSGHGKFYISFSFLDIILTSVIQFVHNYTKFFFHFYFQLNRMRTDKHNEWANFSSK
jgi:hypothetical protein